MKDLASRRPSAAMVIACLALFVALGGSVYAAKSSNKINGSKIKKNSEPGNRIKKNSMPGNRIKKHTITGTQINLAKLGTVPSATNATNATNSQSVDSVKTFSVGANEDQIVTLAKTASFELAGVCDVDANFNPPGVQEGEGGTAIVIYNRGSAPAFSESDDDNNYRLLQNEGIEFNYADNGDGGGAMSTDGHFMVAPGWGNLVADTSYVDEPDPDDDYPFATACHFAGAVQVG